jgi:hypothetical protein
MAEILGLGLSHFPMLAMPDQFMAMLHKMMIRNPELDPDLQDPANWPEAAKTEWGDDEGTTGAAGHRAELVGWMARMRAALDAFNPDLIVMWGDDQYENFQEDVVPPYCINIYETYRISIPRNNVWGETDSDAYDLPGNVAAGKYLVSRLIEEGFDAAYSYKPLHHPLGHAFTNAIHYLNYDRRGFGYPILPISVNCYGRQVISQRGGLPNFEKQMRPEDLDPPAPTPRRLFDLGAATARIMAESPYRVALVASSSWSHAFLNPGSQYFSPDIDADRLLYDALREGRYDVWRSYPAADIEASGQQEVLNWMCLAGALQELGRVAETTGFVRTEIFNSSKVFLISPAAAVA